MHWSVLMLALAFAHQSAPADSGRFTADGLWYRVTGQGPAVVLIHGADLDARSLAPLAPALARDHRVVELELRFHGRSRDGSGPFSFEGDVLSVLDAAGVDRATILGHSLGATVAIDLALARPDRVERLILIGPSYSGFPSQRPPEGIGPVIAALGRGQLDSAGRLLGRAPVMTLIRDTSRQPEVVEMVRANVRLLAADYSRVRPLGPPAAGRLRDLGLPTLILVGNEDPTEAAVAGDSLVAAVAGARLERIARCGHLVPLDCPTEAIDRIRGFLGAKAASMMKFPPRMTFPHDPPTPGSSYGLHRPSRHGGLQSYSCIISAMGGSP